MGKRLCRDVPIKRDHHHCTLPSWHEEWLRFAEESAWARDVVYLGADAKRYGEGIRREST